MNKWYRYGLTGLCFTAILLVSAAHADNDISSERYRVQPGDTLWEITERYRGEAREWPIVRDANRVREPRHIQPGDVLDLPPLPDLTAEVRHREGTAWLVKDSGERISLREDMALVPGDTVETTSHAFVSLRLPHGEDVVLPSSSRAVLKRQDRRSTRLYLERGELEARVPVQRDHREVLSIDTPTGIVGVRGTHFRVTYADDGTRVSTLEGEVALSQGERTTSVSAGQGARSSSTSPAQITDLLPAPVLKEDDSPFDQPLQVDLSAVSGAETYRVQLARDPDFQTIFREQRGDSRSITFEAVPQGFYYARGSAVDAQGFEGLYDRQLVLHRPVNASLETTEGGYVFHWTDIPSLEYRLQLSEDETFNDPFMSRSFSGSQGVTLRNLPTEDFFWRLQVSGIGNDAVDSTVVASGRQGAARQP
ncbi:FecR domain-containing protein [Halomonas sp. I1]|uniref:FecR domain-containing protein n=1 Tax=Halomonas sp. I1 TaxID=393536 RepID=UPI0028DFB43A|nr:FecR domain-containing protein [Halomonas sp. I1]MDT8894753.1 FecR domain-containing protein [Halomonas sp. I1]